MKEFNQQIYLSASFFKMTTTGSSVVDAKANRSVGGLRAFPHPNATIQVVPPKEPWRKQKQKNIIRGEAAILLNKANSSRGDKNE